MTQDMTPTPHDEDRGVAARERVLRLLGMTQRPLRWSELETALGLLSNEARHACEWLMDHGYITPMRRFQDGAARSMEALWTLADKGNEWAMRNGALRPARVPVERNRAPVERRN